MKTALQLYQKYYVDREYEGLDLFQLLRDQYGVQSALYPGSFVHVTPSFVFPVTAYVDSDRQAKRAFGDPELLQLIRQRQEYDQDPQVVFYAADYTTPFGAQDESFDLLVSQYAGLISRSCKRYLRIGGLLLANNSHGDAGIAALDPDYRLAAVTDRCRGRYRVSESNLDAYFIPKKQGQNTSEIIEQLGRGIAYTKTATSYLFRRVR